MAHNNPFAGSPLQSTGSILIVFSPSPSASPVVIRAFGERRSITAFRRHDLSRPFDIDAVKSGLKRARIRGADWARHLQSRVTGKRPQLGLKSSPWAGVFRAFTKTSARKILTRGGIEESHRAFLPLLVRVSVCPLLMSHWKAVESLPVKLPPGHESIHQCHKAVVVSGFEQMNHFVHDDVFQTFWRLLGQFGVKANRLKAWAA